MRIIIDKKLQPQVRAKLDGIKFMELYNFSGYSQKESVLEAPSSDLVLNVAIDIARIGVIVEAYEVWFEIPDANIDNDVPEGVSFETFLDEFEVEQTRTWADLELNAQGDNNSLRFWQPNNNGQFLFEDVEIIQEAGFIVYGKQSLLLRLNEDEYTDTGAPEYSVIKTIQYIDENWRFGGYFDMLDACLSMQEIYEAKGIDDDAQWAASTDVEKEILVRWNRVGIAKANTLLDPGWSEGRKFKELSRKYREFNTNMSVTLMKRLSDYFQYLQLILSGSGRIKFDPVTGSDPWVWNNQHEYINNHLRFHELGDDNKLINWHDTVLITYTNANFIGSLTATQITNSLRKVLVDKEYFI